MFWINRGNTWVRHWSDQRHTYKLVVRKCNAGYRWNVFVIEHGRCAPVFPPSALKPADSLRHAQESAEHVAKDISYCRWVWAWLIAPEKKPARLRPAAVAVPTLRHSTKGTRWIRAPPEKKLISVIESN